MKMGPLQFVLFKKRSQNPQKLDKFFLQNSNAVYASAKREKLYISNARNVWKESYVVYVQLNI